MPKERIDHALHALNATMRRFIDNYSHKRENDQLTGANTWVILFIAEHSGSPFTCGTSSAISASRGPQPRRSSTCSCARALWSATSARPTRACAA